MKIVCNNPNASHLYFLLDKYEAGIILTGDEIKSVRAGHISIKESFVSVKHGEVILKNAYIEQYSNAYDGNRKKADERKDRKLLLHKTEIKKLTKAVEQELKINRFELVHALGHGVGLDVHEIPVLTSKYDNLLKENMVVAVEPGIYIPRSFGIRIEDTVLITKTGCIKLTNSEKNYTIIPWFLVGIVVKY